MKTPLKGVDLNPKLKLLGVDVGGLGDAYGHTPGDRSYVYLDKSKGIYNRLIVKQDNKTLLGVVLVGTAVFNDGVAINNASGVININAVFSQLFYSSDGTYHC